MLFSKSPIGYIQIPSFQEKEVADLSDEQLIQKAIDENKAFCISPATYAMIEKRFLGRELQQRINSKVGLRHDYETIFNLTK